MTCSRAFELDLAAFVRDPRAAEWSAFREHYPRCADCAVEVRVWTELDRALLAGSHPDPDHLARFAAAELDAGAHRDVTAHLASCRTCRDELTALRRFDFRALDDEATASVLPPRRRSWIPRLLWHPAFAYAVALTLVLYPLLRGSPPASVPAPERRVLVENDADRANLQVGTRDGSRPADQPETRSAQAPPPAPPAERLMAKREAKSAEAIGSLERRKDERGRSADAVEPMAAGSAARSVLAPVVVSLDAGTEPSISLAATAGGVRLRLGGAAPAGLVVVRDLDRDRRLEVRAAAAPEGRFDVAVPRGWLAEGRYRVDPPGLMFRVGP